MLKKEQSCQNNPEDSYTERKAKNKPSGYSLSLICSFDETKKRHKLYRRKDCIKRFCNDLKELATEIINYKEEEMTPLKDKELLFIKVKKYVTYGKKSFIMIKIRKVNMLFIIKSKIIAITPGIICNLRYKVPKKIPVVFHNGSKYDHHFIIKQIAEDFKGQFERLGENTEKYITFSVPIKEDDNSKKITYKLKFIDSYRFMQSKLSDLVDNLSKINRNESPKCKGKCEFIGSKNHRLHYRCKERKNIALSQKMD